MGGVISAHRDLALIIGLVQIVRSGAQSPAILVCVDGLGSYVTAFRRGVPFGPRPPVHTGRQGRPRLVAEPGLLLAQVVKQYAQRHVVSVSRRIVPGAAEAVGAVIAATPGGTDIKTAYIERLDATFRSSLAPLVRRGRAIARTDAVLTAGMYLVGCAYNFGWIHASLRQPAPSGSGRKWQERTPAMAAGLTDHCWTMSELLHYQVPLPQWVAPKRRGRPPKASKLPATAVAA